MTNEERCKRIDDTLLEKEKQTNGEFTNVIAMVHTLLFKDDGKDAFNDTATYLASLMGEDSTVEGYLDQLERFLGLQ